MTRYAVAAAAILVGLLLGGCDHSRFDYQLYVENDTDKTYLFKLPWGPPHADKFQVHRVAAGKSGIAGEWFEDPEPVIKLLDEDCREVGTFARTAGNSWTVDSAPRVTAVIQPGDTRAADGTFPEIFGAIGDCGGYYEL